MRTSDLYTRTNDSWQAKPHELPKLTGQEAVSAVKRLYRKATGRAFKGKFKVTSGNRRTWIWNGVYVVNPDQGWHDIVHDVSHLCHRKINRGEKPHSPRHARLEKMLIEHIISNGWLDGALKREEKPEPPKSEIRVERLKARLERWLRIERRAATAIKKINRSLRYYEKKAS